MNKNGKTTEWFKDKVKNYHENKVEVLSEYVNGTTKIKFVYHCDKHGDTYGEANAKNICKDYFLPCKKCQSENKSKSAKNSAKKDKQFYYNRLKKYCEDNGGELLTTEWTTAKDYYWFKCGNPNHPKFTTTADALYSGNHWCPYCSGRKGNFEDEIKDIIENNNGELLSEYSNQYNKVKVKCNNDNYVWDIMPLNLKKGRWCPVCSIPYSEKVVWDYLNKSIDLKKFKIRVQYRFEDLKTNNESLRFDFAILDINNDIKLLLEVDDEEHRYNHKKSERRIKARERDYIKNDYCSNNNIKLIRYSVPFKSNKKWEYNKYYNDIKNKLNKYIEELN